MIINVGTMITPKRKAASGGGTPAFSIKSLSFGGTNQWINRTNAAAQNFATTGTWSVWIKGAGVGNYGAFYQTGENSVIATRGISLLDTGDTAKKMNMQYYDSTNQDRWTSSVTVFDNTWHHIVCTFNSGTAKIYIDRVEDTSKVHTAVGGVTTLNTTTVLYGLHCGAQVTNTTPATFFAGYLNNLTIWNVEFSQTDINNLASGGKPTDLSGHAQFANCKGWYKLGDGDSIAANGLLDSSGNNLHLTPNNMVAGDIVTDAP